MRILLSDASGLTSRQLSTILSLKNHTVHVLSPPGLTLTKFTKHVEKIHRVPAFGVDPYAWLDAAVAIMSGEQKKGEGEGRGAFDVLICTQEQIAVVAAERERVEGCGVRVAVPEFEALRCVIGKCEAVETLRGAGLRQPGSVVLRKQSDLEHLVDFLPGFLKTEIGTASTGMRKVGNEEELWEAVKHFARGGAFDDEDGKLLLQKEIRGPLLMISSVFSHGRLIAWHACIRALEGVNGGASKKVSLPLPVVQEDLVALGGILKWNGALSMDAILFDEKPYYIDINPRIVEPMNALLSGVDLVDPLLQISLGNRARSKNEETVKFGIEGVETHQLVLVLLKATMEGRRVLCIEVWRALTRSEKFKGSREELTPVGWGDLWSLLVLIGIVVMLLVGGKTRAEKLTGGAVKNYALSREGWEEILRRQDEKGRDKKEKGSEEEKKEKGKKDGNWQNNKPSRHRSNLE
jgi:biotin carboxylase